MKISIDTSLIIYLNAKLLDDEAETIDNFWLNLATSNTLYTNILVLNEVIHVSKKTT